MYKKISALLSVAAIALCSTACTNQNFAIPGINQSSDAQSVTSDINQSSDTQSVTSGINQSSDASSVTNTTTSESESSLATAEMSDEEFLYTIGEWENKNYAPIIWVFNKDGTGKVSSDSSKDYDWIWKISGNMLAVNIESLYTGWENYEIYIDRNNTSFTIVNEYGEKSTFVKKGTGDNDTSEIQITASAPSGYTENEKLSYVNNSNPSKTIKVNSVLKNPQNESDSAKSVSQLETVHQTIKENIISYGKENINDYLCYIVRANDQTKVYFDYNSKILICVEFMGIMYDDAEFKTFMNSISIK